MDYTAAMATEPLTDPADEIEAPSAAQKRMRAEAIQRLQVGLSGLGAMLLLVSLAGIITSRATEVEQAAVPETTVSAASDGSAPMKDPLVDAGVVPQLPVASETPDDAAAGAAPRTQH
jgi:hypothetical protein